MAAAVAVEVAAPVHFENEDSSDDDDFADELEAQLFEAEARRVAIGVKRERDEKGLDEEEPSTKRVVRDVGRAEQHDGREGLTTLPLELSLQILRWLSPEDLTSCATTCRALRLAASEDTLWRRCFCSRFGHPKRPGVRSWRALYFQEDARELRLTTSSAPPDLRHLYTQMQSAKRAQPPATLTDDALLTLTDAENVSRWRAQQGLSDGSDPASRHTCSIANGCSYRRFGADIFVCERTGRAHMCDDSCRERVVDMDGMSEMCSISGRSFDRFLGDGAEGMAAGHVDGGAGEVGFTGERGWLGRAFEAGYGASSEKELYAALWGGDGSAGMRANRGVDTDDEVGSDESSDYDSE